MGSVFSSLEDNRPVLRVRVKRIENLTRSDDDDAELDAYVQVTYGKLQPKMTERGLINIDPSLADTIEDGLQKIKSISENTEDDIDSTDPTKLAKALSSDSTIKDNDDDFASHSRDSLSSGTKGTTTQKGSVKKTRDQSRYFDQTFYFPVPALTARYSLEISVWDKEFGPQVTDDYIGKEIIYYARKEQEVIDERDNNPTENSKIQYFLPSKWDEIKELTIDIKDANGNVVTGTVYVDIEFQKFRKDEYLNNDNNNNDEDDLLLNNPANKSNGKKRKSKTRPKRNDVTGDNAPQSSCCSF